MSCRVLLMIPDFNENCGVTGVAPVTAGWSFSQPHNRVPGQRTSAVHVRT